MNPEFVRNLWLEATPFRLALVTGLLLLAFTASTVIAAGPETVALALYWFFVVLWGTRSAALSVVGEIRERTWDGQKLSAIGPVEMVWGKLFGATIHNWFGGLLCLVLVVAVAARTQGVAVAAAYGLILLLIGVLAQAVALLSSLMLIRRNTGNWRLDTFLCQVGGILAAAIYYSLARSTAALAAAQFRDLEWWGRRFDYQGFQTVSLILATGWALVGCWRAMRAELRFSNGPFVWLAWLAYLFVYQAGFSSLLPQRFFDVTGLSPLLAHLLLGGLALMASAYGMAFLERKDPVRLRWLGAQLRAGRPMRTFLALDAWMLSYGATLAVGTVLIVALALEHSPLAPAVLAMLGFMTRDIVIFVLLGRIAGGKGDFAALAVLAALYLLLPLIVGGGVYQSPGGGNVSLLGTLFVPVAGSLVSSASAWVQAVAVVLGARLLIRANA